MAVGQESEKETWIDESLASPADSESWSRDTEKSDSSERPNRLRQASSAAFRSAQHGLSKVSSASVRLYRHSWPKFTNASVRLYKQWPEARSRTVQIYRHVSPKFSSASFRLYRHVWRNAPLTGNTRGQQGTAGTSAETELSPFRSRLEATSMTLRLFQLASALYVFISVMESFQNKITYDGRVRQIQPMMLTTLIYSVIAIVCFLLINLSRRLRASAWQSIALASLPGDMAMIGLFVAKDVIFGVHSFECASVQAMISAHEQYSAAQKMNSLELRSFLDNGPSIRPLVWASNPAGAKCLLSSGVYVVCAGAALSYIASVGLTAVQLLHYRKSSSGLPAGQYPGHIEEAVPGIMQFPPQMYERGRLVIAPMPAAGFSWSSPSPYPPAPQSPKYANMPAELFESMSVVRPPRTSEETTSSMDPDQYIVSDGFRPGDRSPSPSPSDGSEQSDRPPSYRSSRESSLGPPEYRSRPPSLHAIVMVGL